MGRIFASAQGKLGDKVDAPGEVPPKVLKTILNEGSYATDPLAIEYFGGMLASARTEGGRDDRSARLAKIVDSLSTYQLRAHFLFYTTIRRLFRGKGVPFNMEGRPKMQIFIPATNFAEAMEFIPSELDQFSQLLSHIFFGLHGDSLIDDFQFGDEASMKKHFSGATESGVVCTPSAFGAELFLSAFGWVDRHLEDLFSDSFPSLPDGVPDGFLGAAPTRA